MKHNLFSILSLVALAIAGACVLVARQMPYGAQTTVVPVVHSGSSAAVPQTTAYVMRLFAEDLAQTRRDVRVAVKREGDSDAVHVTVSGVQARVVAETMRDVLVSNERTMQTVYGADVRFSVLRADRIVQKRAIVMRAPYGAMIAFAAALLFAVLWFFDMRTRRTVQRPAPMSPWEARRIFASVHAPLSDTPSTHMQSQQSSGSVQDGVQEDHVTQPDDTEMQKDATLPMEKGVPPMRTRTVPTPTPAGLPVHLPSGLQTTPGNLPVVDVATLGIAHTDMPAPTAKADSSPGTDDALHTAEPTTEELKARLNALLGGTLL